jgi:hypothetical protein
LIHDGRIDIHTFDHQGYNALHHSITMDDDNCKFKFVQCLLDDGHADLTSTSSDGENVFDMTWHEYTSGDAIRYGIDLGMLVFLVTRILEK